MKRRDYQYDLKPDWQCDVKLSESSSHKGITWFLLNVTQELSDKLDNYTLWLRFGYRSTHKKKQASIGISSALGQLAAIEQQQFFEVSEQGVRYLDLSTISSLDNLYLACQYAKVDPQAQLLAFKKPDFGAEPTLIIAPHADDAELAAYGFYQDFADKVWITTIFAGHTLQKLDKQYINHLDTDINDAINRKAKIRAWNSMTTPLLAGVDYERLSYLGYHDISKEALYQAPNDTIKTNDTLVAKAHRSLNRISLPNDEAMINSPQALVDDLVSLLEQIKPIYVMVTDPDIDPHHEHITSAHALALAIEQSTHKPTHMLLYINHLRQTKKFPYGPEHCQAGLAPWYDELTIKQRAIYSHPLDRATQKNKVVAFDSMHDLSSKDRLEKKLKQWWQKKVLKNGYQYYSNHSYFQTHIKSNEVFSLVGVEAFCTNINRK